MILDLASVTQGCVAKHADVCVIGAGLAGLLASKRIADAGRSVIVLESGGREPDAALDTLNEVDDEAQLYQNAVSGRVRALGGTSSAWGGRLMPLTAHDVAARHHIGLAEWSIGKSELDRHVGDIEALFKLDGSSFEKDFATPFSLEALCPDSDHMHSRWAKWPTFKRRNIARILADRIRSDPRLEVWLNATACDFSFDVDAGRIAAIQARNRAGQSLEVKANQFVLACGTLEATRLLLLLDRATQGRVFGECDALGRYFNDHLALPLGRLRSPPGTLANRIFGYHIGGLTRRSLHLETTATAQVEDEAASGFVTVRPEFDENSIGAVARRLGKTAQAGAALRLLSGKALLHNALALGPALFWRLAYQQMHFGKGINLFLDARIEQVPRWGSRLTLSPNRDHFGVPRLQLEWQKSEADERTFRSVARRARRFWTSTVLDRACPIFWDRDPDDPSVSFTAGSRDTRHPAGSARMGRDRRTSVVDRTLRCHAVPNLLVASAAVFPSSGSANPTLTIMQLACIAADQAVAAA